MDAQLITYSLGDKSTAIQNQLRMKLIGQTSTSHRGKYKFHRKGLLEEIKHIKPSRGTMIIPLNKSKKVIQLLRKYKAKIKIYDISIKKSSFD